MLQHQASGVAHFAANSADDPTRSAATGRKPGLLTRCSLNAQLTPARDVNLAYSLGAH